MTYKNAILKTETYLLINLHSLVLHCLAIYGRDETVTQLGGRGEHLLNFENIKQLDIFAHNLVK